MTSRPGGDGRSGKGEPTLDSLARRVSQLTALRPVYREFLDFYAPVFRLQIEWQARLRAHPSVVEAPDALRVLADGEALVARFDAGLDEGSLAELWVEMKDAFRGVNAVLDGLVEGVEKAERGGVFEAGPWLTRLRPQRPELVVEAAGALGVDAGVLGTLARAVTYPHWRAVSRAWLPTGRLSRWQRFRCPVCEARPVLGELRTEPGPQPELKAAPERLLHCGFCGSCWSASPLTCPGCESQRAGDARYYFTPDDPGVRIDFCAKCKKYLKVIDGDRLDGPLHVGLELLASIHLDQIATGKGLAPLEAAT